jgi:hypothetical protein
MAVVLVHHGPSLTQERYEEVVKRLTGGKGRRLETPGDWPVEGLMVHIAGRARAASGSSTFGSRRTPVAASARC